MPIRPTVYLYVWPVRFFPVIGSPWVEKRFLENACPSGSVYGLPCLISVKLKFRYFFSSFLDFQKCCHSLLSIGIPVAPLNRRPLKPTTYWSFSSGWFSATHRKSIEFYNRSTSENFVVNSSKAIIVVKCFDKSTTFIFQNYTLHFNEAQASLSKKWGILQSFLDKLDHVLLVRERRELESSTRWRSRRGNLWELL